MTRTSSRPRTAAASVAHQSGLDPVVSNAFGVAILAAIVATTCARLDTDWKWLVVLPLWIAAVILAVLWLGRNDHLGAVPRFGWPGLAIGVGTVSILLAADRSIRAFWQYLPPAWLLTAGAILILAASARPRHRSRELAAGVAALAIGTTAAEAGLVLLLNHRAGLGIALVVAAVAVIRAGYALLGDHPRELSGAFVVAGLAVTGGGIVALSDDRIGLGVAAVLGGIVVIAGGLVLLLPGGPAQPTDL